MKKHKLAKIANIFGWKKVAEVVEILKKAKEYNKAIKEVEEYDEQMRKGKKITKKNKPEFFGEGWQIKRKDVPPVFGNTKSEDITIKIKMTSFGDTSTMSDKYIINQAVEKLNSIS